MPASTFLTKIRKFFAQCQEMIKNLDRFSDIPNGKSSTECRKGLAQCANKTSQNHPMPSSKAVFTTLPKSFRQKFESFSLISEKDKNTYIISKKNNFPPGFPWTGRFQFWQSYSKYFDQKLKKTAQWTTMIKNYTFFSKKSSLKCCSGHVEYRFYNRKFSARCQKWQRIVFFEKILLEINL